MADHNPYRDYYARGIPNGPNGINGTGGSGKPAPSAGPPAPVGRLDLTAGEVLAGPTARPFAVTDRTDATVCHPAGPTATPAPTAIDGDASRAHWLKLLIWAASLYSDHHMQLAVPSTAAEWLAAMARHQGMTVCLSEPNRRGSVLVTAWNAEAAAKGPAIRLD